MKGARIVGGKLDNYHTNYATIKARGVYNETYTLTAHRGCVKMSGFEMSESDKRKQSQIRMERVCNEKPVDERFRNSIIRSKNSVLQLASNNPWEYFVTLTFRRKGVNFDVKSIVDVKRVVLKFFKNYAARSGAETDFKYLLIPELHKDGSIHFHGLMSGINPKDLYVNKNGYLDFRPYSEKFGFISFGISRRKGKNKCTMGKIRDLEKTATYISKYICKEMFGKMNFEPGTHLYYASKGLKKDRLIQKGKLIAPVDVIPADSQYENEYCVKLFADTPENFLKVIVPFVNKVKRSMNMIGRFTPALFMENYGAIARALGCPLYEYDYVNKTPAFHNFIRLWEAYKENSDSLRYDSYNESKLIFGMTKHELLQLKEEEYTVTVTAQDYKFDVLEGQQLAFG